MRRDATMTGDDTVSLVLDTYGDHRTGYFFQINGAGARQTADFRPAERLARLGWHLGCANGSNTG